MSSPSSVAGCPSGADSNVYSQAWWFITSIGHRPDPSETLPISYFPTQETELYKTSVQQDAFRGGRGSITLTRYTDSPIGGNVFSLSLFHDLVAHSKTDT